MSSKVSIRGLLTVAVLGLCAGVLSSCSGGQALTNDVAQDPEALSRSVIEAAYDRDYEFLWSTSSLTLQEQCEFDQETFEQWAESRLEEYLPAGSPSIGDSEYVDHIPAYRFAVESSNAPTTSVQVALAEPGEGSPWKYDAFGFHYPSEPAHRSFLPIVGGEDYCN